MNPSKTLPQCICEHCLSRLLYADSIKKLCIKNEKFLVQLAENFVPSEATGSMTLDVKKAYNEEYLDEIDFENLSEVEPERPITPIELDIIKPPSPVEAFDWQPYLELNEQTKRKNHKPKTSFFCTYCFKEFNTRAKCLYHERVKHGPKKEDDNVRPWSCDRCGLT